MGKTFNLGLVIGRFQHLHIAHTKMIDTALATCDRVLLLVGSSQESMTERNPFNLKTRMDLIRDYYGKEIHAEKLLLGHIDDMTNENDICVEWGDFVLQKVDMWSQHYGLSCELDCMIFGNDEERMGWYRPEVAEKISQIAIARTHPVSATKMRNHIVNNNLDIWIENMPESTSVNKRYWFYRLRDELVIVPHYKEMMSDDNNQ